MTRDARVVGKKKWGDMTTLSPAVAKNGKIDPRYIRMRVWREREEFNGLALPKTWRWKRITCHCCGTVKDVKEYASWHWIDTMAPSVTEKIEEFIKSDGWRQQLNKAYEAKSGFAKLFGG